MGTLPALGASGHPHGRMADEQPQSSSENEHVHEPALLACASIFPPNPCMLDLVFRLARLPSALKFLDLESWPAVEEVNVASGQ